MGKRKDRRLAALTNAGRRVKLDLFAEPSGDLGGSSVNGNVGGDTVPTQCAGLPNSPSSSGQPQNPLLLLGQYSDDELDEESNRGPDHAVAENSPSDHINQEERPSKRKETDANALGDAGPKAEQRDMERDSTPVDALQSSEGGNSEGIDAAASSDKFKEVDSAKQISVCETPDAQAIGDVSSGWRIVMHEESNQYYYWNTETGETSWEVPDVLAQTTLGISDHRIPATESVDATLVNTNESSEFDNSSATLTVDGPVGANLIHQSQVVDSNGLQIDEGVQGYKIEPLKDSNWDSRHQNETESNQGAAHVLLGGEVTNDELEKGIDHSTNLMRQCDCLMERLKSLKGYGSRLKCHDQIEKYILEVDIRLSDIKSLSSYGSSLLPFWAHSQRQLKQLEDVINNEIYHLAVSAQMEDDAGEITDTSFKEKEKSSGSMGHDSDADGHENCRKSEFAKVAVNVENDSSNDPHENVYSGGVSSLGSPNGHLEAGAVGSEKVNRTAVPEPEFHSVEDVDMEVDMEVEDGVTASITVLGDGSSIEAFVPAKQLSQPNTPPEYPTVAIGDESTVPPPPEEDWIPPPPPDGDQVPPPPPDSDQVPPPPPDEPSESSYPPLPSYTESGQPLPYTQQYNLPYADSNFQYYGHTVNVSSSNFYGHVDGSQVGVPHASLYYEAVASSYTETAPIMVSSVEQVAYYNLQDGSVPSVPVVSGVEPSTLQTDSGPVNYDSFGSDQIKTADDAAKSVPNMKTDVLDVTSETISTSVGVTSTSIPTETPAIFNGKENISAPLTNAIIATAAVPATTTTAKVQSKVSRSKKRTVAVAPSLRSNKKVSSLVDKWKAAKEELNENEENEPENAYELLERKRQREIEEWHAKQIASGEAKDNANFQPLGGDWRERVKRRRARAAKETAQTPSEAPIEENQQPDLAELSKGLPSGWQAYWDEASKQFYYGNAITSETTWSKPTK